MENETDNPVYLGRLISWIKIGWFLNCVIALAICAIVQAESWKTVMIIAMAVISSAAYLYTYMPLLQKLANVTQYNAAVKIQGVHIGALISIWILLLVGIMTDSVNEIYCIIGTIAYMIALAIMRRYDRAIMRSLAEGEYDCDIFVGCGCK